MGKTSGFWTDERVEQVTALWAEGYSFLQISEKMNCTRNQVAGKITRERLPWPAVKQPKTMHPYTPRGRPAPRPKPVQVWSAPSLLEIHTGSRHLSLMDLEPHHCRWPIGDPRTADFYFCAADRLEDRSYCARHHNKAIQR
jgi:GcrA cell cycle regulator